MILIDSHCHLLSYQDEGELHSVLDRASNRGVRRFFAVGTSLKDWVPYRQMRARLPGVVDYSVGLHPCHVDAYWNDAVSQLSTFFIPPHPPKAFGEIGLDYFHLPSDPIQAGEQMILQEDAFRQQLMLADELLEGPVIIHSRKAFADTIRMIDESGLDWARIVFHCFSYGPSEIEQINERGGRASFTGIVTYKNADSVRSALRCQGLERLMLETDSPYLSPEPHRGHPNEPAFLADIAECCARLLGVSLGELAEATSQNTIDFFKLD